MKYIKTLWTSLQVGVSQAEGRHQAATKHSVQGVTVASKFATVRCNFTQLRTRNLDQRSKIQT